MRLEGLKRSPLVLAILLITISGLVVGACSSTRTTGEQIDDGWISTKIKAKLTGDADINPFNINVNVVDGVVTLGGKVRHAHAKEQAERYAERTKGVKQVINQIEVEPEASS